ncbi:MAG: Ribosome-binding factor A [Parcubacteria bacterium C7867-001]|nr:MAG: Ribosome-binding factor A [Parcubacteria bacterium C7867-001]
MSIRDDRANSILIHLAAEYISREAGRGTLITPTRAEFASDRKNATIYVSVFPDGEEEHVLAFLIRHQDLFRDYLKQQARFPILPRVRFAIDYGEKNRQHLDDISKDL